MMSKVDIMWFMSDLAIILYCRYYFPLHFINAYYSPFMFSLNKEYIDFRKKCELFGVQKKFLNSKNILILKSVQFLRDLWQSIRANVHVYPFHILH